MNSFSLASIASARSARSKKEETANFFASLPLSRRIFFLPSFAFALTRSLPRSLRALLSRSDAPPPPKKKTLPGTTLVAYSLAVNAFLLASTRLVILQQKNAANEENAIPRQESAIG